MRSEVRRLSAPPTLPVRGVRVAEECRRGARSQCLITSYDARLQEGCWGMQIGSGNETRQSRLTSIGLYPERSPVLFSFQRRHRNRMLARPATAENQAARS